MKDEKIDVKIGSKEEKYWADIRDRTMHEIEQLENLLKFNKAILKMCDEMIAEEILKNGI